jgi:methionine biosynthesis protein MetW
MMRADLDTVASLVPTGSRVLDLGCGHGALLEHLIRERGCDGRGIDSSAEGFLACVRRGVPVVQADLDDGLADYDDASFDVVVLSQTLQATRRPAFVLQEVARVGRAGIVSFPNFGYWRLRTALALGGRMPSSGLLPYSWYDTPNIHLCTVSDFERLARSLGVRVARRIPLDAEGRPATGAARHLPNLLASAAVYLLGDGR